jgi:predicted nucleic acid-binding protein
MRGADYFLDSNVILYMISSDETKANVTEEMLLTGGYISVQVLNEVTNVARRKYKVEWIFIDRLIENLKAQMTIQANTVENHTEARRIAERYQFNIYDAQIISSALFSNCSILYSEDMQHGQVIENRLTICNPFI